ncbi:MAG: hypothetical protein LBE79_09675 [Tannerella sp.]|jgi:hypothetical protein|nr:hypothetical protein [Tannerella sp.]
MRLLIILYVNLFSCFIIYGQEKTKWDYPVKPGTEEWKKFQSNEEMVNSCQIPDVVLSTLTTEELVDLSLRYPLIYDVFAFENMNSGLNKLFNDFNGIRELYNKSEVSNNLIKRYSEQIKIFSILDGKSTEYEKGKFIVTVSLMEVLLCRCVEQNDADKEKSKEILRALVAGYEGKLKYIDYFKGVGFRSNVYSRVNVISEISEHKIEKLPQKEKNLVKFSGLADEQALRIIDEVSYQLIK